MDLSIIIVNHNTRHLTAQTIRSVVFTTKTTNYEIIVIDNSTNAKQEFSVEEIHEILPELQINNNTIQVKLNAQNNGFGAACNIGLALSKGTYILFLNPDTIVYDGVIDGCMQYLIKNPEIGALGVRTLLENGILDHGCKRGFPTPSNSLFYMLGIDRLNPLDKKYGGYRLLHLDEHQIHRVDSVSGAFLLSPTNLIQNLNGFDEDFFMYGEDIDLCYRVKQAGYSVVYNGKFTITHLKGQSGLHKSNKTVIFHFYNAMKIFYNKHYKKIYNPLITLAVYSGIQSKYLLTLAKNKLSAKGITK